MTQINLHADDRFGTTVFLLGAGCSASAGAPVMRNFLETANDDHAETNPIFGAAYEVLFDFVAECRKISSVFNRDWHNIEELYSQANLAEMLGVQHAKERCDQLAWAIWDVYRRHSKNTSDYYNFVRCIDAVRARWRRDAGGRPVIITTNYDINFEIAWIYHGDMGRAVSYPGGPLDAGGEDSRIRTHSSPLLIGSDHDIEVIKLHGSVNWFRKSPDDRIVIERGVDDADKRKLFAVQTDDFARRMLSESSIRPLVMPPSLGKEADTKFIKDHWLAAISAIRHARDIFVLGYSFPETDVFMTRLLSEGIRDNRRLTSVHIVNPSVSKSWKKSVSDLFATPFSNYRLKWHIGTFADLGISLSLDVPFDVRTDAQKEMERLLPLHHMWQEFI